MWRELREGGRDRRGTRAPDGKAGGPLDGGLAGPGQEVTGSCPLFRAVPLYLLCSRVSSLEIGRAHV